MSDLESEVRKEIADLHRFFVGWFGGTVDEGDLERVLVPRLDDDFFYVTPDGHRLGHDDTVTMLRGGYGKNPEIRIETRDVTIRRDCGACILVTYTEWQKGARASAKSENARLTTVLLTKERPFRWQHIHETWLPEAERAAGSYEF